LTIILLPVANLTAQWCYSTVTPTFLLAIAIIVGGAGWPHRSVATSAVPLTWLAVLGLMTAEALRFPRTNIKEVAEYLHAHVSPSDRLLVVPGYVVPSFARYFGSDERAMSIPESGLHSYIPYDRRVARDLDPAAWQRVMNQLDNSRIGCRRLWLVVEHGIPAHMQSLVLRLMKEANERLGRAQIVQPAPHIRGALEHVLVQKYDPCRIP
jgi:hypothetical protein